MEKKLMAASKLCKAGAQSGCLVAFVEVAGIWFKSWCCAGVCRGSVLRGFLVLGCSVRLVDVLWAWAPGWWQFWVRFPVIFLSCPCALESAHTRVSVCAYNLVSAPTILARWAPARKRMFLLLKSTQFHLFRRHKSDTAYTKLHACVFIPHAQSKSPLESPFCLVGRKST